MTPFDYPWMDYGAINSRPAFANYINENNLLLNELEVEFLWHVTQCVNIFMHDWGNSQDFMGMDTMTTANCITDDPPRHERATYDRRMYICQEIFHCTENDFPGTGRLAKYVRHASQRDSTGKVKSDGDTFIDAQNILEPGAAAQMGYDRKPKRLNRAYRTSSRERVTNERSRSSRDPPTGNIQAGGASSSGGAMQHSVASPRDEPMTSSSLPDIDLLEQATGMNSKGQGKNKGPTKSVAERDAIKAEYQRQTAGKPKGQSKY